MADTYNSNSVGHSVPSGGGMTFKTPTGVTLGVFVVTAINPDRDGGPIGRSNNEGGAGGFCLGENSEKQNTASATIQIKASTVTRPYAGCYVDQDFKRGAERWVIVKVGDTFQAGTSWEMTADFWRDHEV